MTDRTRLRNEDNRGKKPDLRFRREGDNKRKQDDIAGSQTKELQSLFDMTKPENISRIADMAIDRLVSTSETLGAREASVLAERTRSQNREKAAIDKAISIVKKIKEYVDKGDISAAEKEVQTMLQTVESHKKIKGDNKVQQYNSYTNAFDAISEAANRDIPKEVDPLKRENDLLKREADSLKRDLDKFREKERINKLVKESMPKLSKEAKKAYKEIEHLHSQAKRIGEGDATDVTERHTEAFERLLGHLSPETLQEFKDHGVKFVTKTDAKVFYLTMEKDEEGTKVILPIPYKYRIPGMVLRAIDMCLENFGQEKAAKVDMTELEGGRTQTFDANNSPDPKVRAEMATRAWKCNEELLGSGKGYAIGDDPMPKQYHEDYKAGIRRAIIQGEITEDTPISDRREIGHEYARREYLAGIETKEGEPTIYPVMQPGSHCEERDEWDLNEGQLPVKFGSQQYDDMMERLMKRRERGENFTIIINILPPKEGSEENRVLVQPFYAEDMEGELRSHHGNNARGEHSIFSGEVDIDHNSEEILRIKDQSGHYRTYDPKNPDSAIMYALGELGKKYNTSETEVQLTAIEGAKEVPYRGYQPSYNRQNESMEAIERFRREQQERGDSVGE